MYRILTALMGARWWLVGLDGWNKGSLGNSLYFMSTVLSLYHTCSTSPRNASSFSRLAALRLRLSNPSILGN